ncbi:uncharacterized protein LOC134228075 [Armigeres subalbatus]|uniref:uncharacterized protein LOC134228075 n=1 Tax=Armigeres subalbatus TaxID=124917 RepID=UPI002ED6A9A4
MSRGSYQRRVFITVLQHNDGYTWQEQHMRAFTGDDPGFFMQKMIQEKTMSSLRMKKARNKPGYCRRKVTQCIEVEHDYGEEAVTAMEESEDVTHDCTTIESKYKVTEATREQLSSSTSITDMEEITMGRILTKFVPEIIGCKESNKWKKCDMILQATTTWNYLKSKRAIVGLVLRSLKEQHGVNMGECKMFVDTCHQYLCCVADAISEDGTTVLLIKKHDTKETVLKRFRSVRINLDAE